MAVDQHQWNHGNNSRRQSDNGSRCFHTCIESTASVKCTYPANVLHQREDALPKWSRIHNSHRAAAMRKYGMVETVGGGLYRGWFSRGLLPIVQHWWTLCHGRRMLNTNGMRLILMPVPGVSFGFFACFQNFYFMKIKILHGAQLWRRRIVFSCTIYLNDGVAIASCVIFPSIYSDTMRHDIYMLHASAVWHFSIYR